MMINRLKQGFLFIFGKYKEEWNREVETILSKNEFEIFREMSRYDKIHSFRLLKLVEKDEILKEKLIYKKLALLHDCGKYNASLYKRIKKVFIGEKSLDKHSDIAFEKLKEINYELAILAKNHHTNTKIKELKRFQELDDK